MLADLQKTATVLEGHLHKLAAKSLFESEEGEALRARLRRIQGKSEQFGKEESNSDPFSDFTPRNRTLLLQIIETIHVIEGMTANADKLVGKILSRREGGELHVNSDSSFRQAPVSSEVEQACTTEGHLHQWPHTKLLRGHGTTQDAWSLDMKALFEQFARCVQPPYPIRHRITLRFGLQATVQF